MKKETNRIDELHRKELLKFLLVKTAAVRQGIKPAELLRVRHCYSTVNAELLVLGSSTWGIGDLQDDWAAQLDSVKANFAGKKVATFGLGDSVGFADSFCVAAEKLATAAKDAGATLVGEVLKLDDTNESDQTDGKIAAWVETLKAAL